MNERARFCALFASLMLGAVVILRAETTAGSEAKAPEPEWATSAGGTGLDLASGIATHPAGSSYVTGQITGTIAFGVGEPSETIGRSCGVK